MPENPAFFFPREALMNISFLTSSHKPKDDRIFYHQAKALLEDANLVSIISSKQLLEERSGKGLLIDSFDDRLLSKKEKVRIFIGKLSKHKPEVIIASEPLAVYAAHKYKKLSTKKIRIIYDITEWYPSKKQLSFLPFYRKPGVFLKLLTFNLYASFLTDNFIFGEYYKALPYRRLFPNKKYIFSSYYPDIQYIHPQNPALLPDTVRLSYSGKLTVEKGFDNFLSVVEKLHQKKPGLNIRIKIIGWYPEYAKKEVLYFTERLDSIRKYATIDEFPVQDFDSYLSLIADTDIFLDLRSDDWENQRCLPIKLFYYAALQRPVIYSRLKAIEKEVEIDAFGHLFQPAAHTDIAQQIIHYLEHPQDYYRHCSNARKLAETEYNWNRIKDSFVHFVSEN